MAGQVSSLLLYHQFPYKVFGWVAGMGEMDKRSFIVAGLFGRGLRFGLEALLIGIYGKAGIGCDEHISR